MKITAKQAVATTAKLQKVSKQLSLIGSNLIAGKYNSRAAMLKARASVVNAHNMATRASEELLDEVNSIEDLEVVTSSENSDALDGVIESACEVASKSAMLYSAIEGELGEGGSVEEVSDEILDDNIVEACDEAEAPVVASRRKKATRTRRANIAADYDEVDSEEDVIDNALESVDDNIVNENIVTSSSRRFRKAAEEDEIVTLTSEEDEDDEELEVVEGCSQPETVDGGTITSARRAARKATVVRKASSFAKPSISWTMPSLPSRNR